MYIYTINICGENINVNSNVDTEYGNKKKETLRSPFGLTLYSWPAEGQTHGSAPTILTSDVRHPTSVAAPTTNVPSSSRSELHLLAAGRADIRRFCGVRGIPGIQ